MLSQQDWFQRLGDLSAQLLIESDRGADDHCAPPDELLRPRLGSANRLDEVAFGQQRGFDQTPERPQLPTRQRLVTKFQPIPDLVRLRSCPARVLGNPAVRDQSLDTLRYLAGLSGLPVLRLLQQESPEKQVWSLPEVQPPLRVRLGDLPPQQELAVFVQPFAEPVPVADQSFVHDVRGLVARRIARGDDQPLVGKRANNRPQLLPQLGSALLPFGIIALARQRNADELQQRAPHLLLGVPLARQLRESGIGVPGERAFEPAHRLVVLHPQATIDLLLPELVEGELHQRKQANSAQHCGKDGLAQTGLEADSELGCRPGNRLRNLPCVHPRKVKPPPVERRSKDGMAGHVPGEVRPQRGHQMQRCRLRTRRCNLVDDIGKARPLPLVRAQREQLFELIDNQQQRSIRVLPLNRRRHIVDGLGILDEQARPLACALDPDCGRAVRLQERGDCVCQGMQRPIAGPEPCDRPSKLANARQQAGKDDRGLTTAGCTKDHHDVLCADPLKEGFAELRSSKEVGFVLFAERTKTAIGLGEQWPCATQDVRRNDECALLVGLRRNRCDHAKDLGSIGGQDRSSAEPFLNEVVLIRDRPDMEPAAVVAFQHFTVCRHPMVPECGETKGPKTAAICERRSCEPGAAFAGEIIDFENRDIGDRLFIQLFIAPWRVPLDDFAPDCFAASRQA